MPTYSTKPQALIYPRIESKSKPPLINGRLLFGEPYVALNVIQSIAHFAIDFNAALLGTLVGFATPISHYYYYRAIPKQTQSEIEQEHLGEVMIIDQKVEAYNASNPRTPVGNPVSGFSTYIFAKAIFPMVALATQHMAPPLCHAITFLGTVKNGYSLGQCLVSLFSPPRKK